MFWTFRLQWTTIQAVYYNVNIVARSCNHYFSGKAISITYSECVFVASGIQHTTHMRLFVICGLSGSAILSHIISQTARFSGKRYWKYVYFGTERSHPAVFNHLTLNPLTWKIRWAANNASRWQMGFNSAFKGLISLFHICPANTINPTNI